MTDDVIEPTDPGGPPAPPEAKRTPSGRVTVLIGVVAIVITFIAPPIGLALGILALIRGIRLVRATAPKEQELLTPDGVPMTARVAQSGRGLAVFALVLGVVATVLSTLVMILVIVFWSELRDYTDCHDNANTTQGEQKCRDQLQDAIFDRVGR